MAKLVRRSDTTPTEHSQAAPWSESVEIPAGARVLYVSGQVPPVVDAGQPIESRAAYGDMETQTRGVLERLAAKLANAGYYDGLDNGGNYLVGDAHDQNTLIAMRKMLTEAYQSNKPISTLIGERMKSYRMNVRDQRLAGLKQDPGYSRAAANDYAQQVIGRNLQPDELRQVEMYLKSLVRDRASNIGGNETFGRGGQLESDNPRGYDEGDVRAALDQSENFQEDARDMTSRSLDFKLRQLMH